MKTPNEAVIWYALSVFSSLPLLSISSSSHIGTLAIATAGGELNVQSSTSEYTPSLYLFDTPRSSAEIDHFLSSPSLSLSPSLLPLSPPKIATPTSPPSETSILLSSDNLLPWPGER